MNADDKEKEVLAILSGFTSAIEQSDSTWQVWLDIDNQHFRVSDPQETLEEANWYRRMLAVALLNFNAQMNKKQLCSKRRRKKREDW
jgi:hypothetical protein